MSITDELRECATDWGRDLIGSGGKAVLFNIANRIDAEHISMVDQTRNKAWNEGFDDGYASADDYEAALQERGWIRLPKDANGEYIHLGDVIEYDTCGGGVAMVREVDAVGAGCFFAWSDKDSRYHMYEANAYRHHHKPTLEDVLAEFALEIDPSADIAVTGAETIKKFAAKLQLKEPNE